MYRTRSMDFIGVENARMQLNAELALPNRMNEDYISDHRDLASYVQKLKPSVAKRVYERHYEHRLATQWGMGKSYKRRMLDAHHAGLTAVAFLECHCRECRYISYLRVPMWSGDILNAYSREYMVRVPDFESWVMASQCLVVRELQDHSNAILAQHMRSIPAELRGE
jgi:hypothetical protein